LRRLSDFFGLLVNFRWASVLVYEGVDFVTKEFEAAVTLWSFLASKESGE